MTDVPLPVARLRDLAAERGIATTVDEPLNADGFWWIDGGDAASTLSINWKADRGFGIYAADAVFGERPMDLIADPEEALRAALGDETITA